MRRKASQLADYCDGRLGDALRGVGYHTADEYEVVYIRDDVAEQYPPDRMERFIRTSRSIHTGLNNLDEMGRPEASLHALDEGLIIQFHFPEDNVVFLAIDPDVGRNFTQFIHDCRDQIT